MAFEGNIPKTVSDYLNTKHTTIINNYRTPDGKYPEHCCMIAIKIAKLFLEAKREPYIMYVSEVRRSRYFEYSLSLEPVIFKGKIFWGQHVVCACDGQVFDPILKAQINQEDYCEAVFGVDIPIRLMVAPENVLNFINVLPDPK